MEVLNTLEQKIAGLIDLIKELQAEKAFLLKENAALKHQIEQVELSLLVGHKNAEEKNQELVLTKLAVDDLIKSIDLLVGSEQEQS